MRRHGNWSGRRRRRRKSRRGLPPRGRPRCRRRTGLRPCQRREGRTGRWSKRRHRCRRKGRRRGRRRRRRVLTHRAGRPPCRTGRLRTPLRSARRRSQRHRRRPSLARLLRLLRLGHRLPARLRHRLLPARRRRQRRAARVAHRQRPVPLRRAAAELHRRLALVEAHRRSGRVNAALRGGGRCVARQRLGQGARRRLRLPAAAPLDQHVLAAHLPPARWPGLLLDRLAARQGVSLARCGPVGRVRRGRGRARQRRLVRLPRRPLLHRHQRRLLRLGGRGGRRDG
mmetsp:Transcript_18895/g.57329  ORF Transcript_18895/g.57329 Transcript_18895/m.57329 type:complete len:284 (+) Transcript_18895:896-1747(+)